MHYERTSGVTLLVLHARSITMVNVSKSIYFF
jgi:hypothetical protein